MIQMINKLKKNQKGFTLVELIVVLVILAILAAFTIPAMMGFINDARGKANIAEAREIYMAYQTAASEFGAVAVNGVYKSIADPTVTTGGAQDKVQKSALAKLEGDIVNASGSAIINGSEWSVTIGPDSRVSEVQYVKGGYKVTIAYSPSGTSDAVVEKGGTI